MIENWKGQYHITGTMGYENCCFFYISISQHAQTPTPPDEAAGFPPCTSKEKKEGEKQGKKACTKQQPRAKQACKGLIHIFPPNRC